MAASWQAGPHLARTYELDCSVITTTLPFCLALERDNKSLTMCMHKSGLCMTETPAAVLVNGVHSMRL